MAGRNRRFSNAGAPKYFIPLDWRPRNLRRRVEVITPVHDTGARARLNHILEVELADPGSWLLLAQEPGARVCRI